MGLAAFNARRRAERAQAAAAEGAPAAAATPQERPDQEAPAVEAMTVAQLRDLAEQMGLDVAAKARKADLLDAIEAATPERPVEA